MLSMLDAHGQVVKMSVTGSGTDEDPFVIDVAGGSTAIQITGDLAAQTASLANIEDALVLGTAPVEKLPVTASVTSVELLAANASRKKGSVFHNKSETATLYLSLGVVATTNSARAYPPGSIYTMDDTDFVGVVYGVWDIASGQCNIEEAI